MNILLTGSTGFLGGRIKQHLEKEHTVFCLTGNILENWETKPKSWGTYDAAIHLVGLNHHQCEKDPILAYEVNVAGTHNLLASIEAKRVIYFSTIHVYGYPAVGKINENLQVKPESVYAVSHYLAERLVMQRQNNTVIRLSNGWGCPADPNRSTAWIVVMNSICKQAVERKEIELFISEDEQRNFITATDICGAVSHLLTAKESGVFNVGGDQTVRIVDMAYLVADRCQALFGYTPEIKLLNQGSWEFYTPERNGDFNPKLDYRTEKLKATGFSLTENFNEEIDNLLLMCKEKQNEQFSSDDFSHCGAAKSCE